MDTVVRFELTRAYRNRTCKPGPSTTGLHREKNWLAWVESNHQPSVLETAALPVAPHANEKSRIWCCEKGLNLRRLRFQHSALPN